MNFFGGAFGSGMGVLNQFTPPTAAQIQERLKTSGIAGYTPPAPVAAPKPAPVVTPKPTPVTAPAPVAPPPTTIPPISPLFDMAAIEERGRERREYQAAEKARLDALKAEVDARNRAVAAEAEAKAAQVPGANISAYYDALRAGEDPSKFADILQKSLADQDYVSTGMEMAEAGAYASPVEDMYVVPGGLTTEGLGEFTFDKTLEDFKGYDFDYGDISNENLKKFQEELMPVMAPAVAQAQLEGQSYQNALIQAYDRSPEVQEIYAKYDISPQRVSRKYGSEYVYDPFTFSEIQTVDRSPGLSDYVKAGALAIGTTALGGALIAPGASPMTAATTRGLVSAGTTAATGGDPKDILRAGVLGGVSGYAEGLGNAAKAAETAAKGAEAGSELAKAAELARKTSDTFNTVVKTGKFVDAVIDGNLATVAVATFGDDFTKAALDKVDPDNKFFSGLNINKSDLAKGLVKTQMELARGVDFEDALIRGVGEYIMEGGALGPNNIKTPEFIKAIGDVIREAGSMFDDTVLQPIKGIVEPVVDVARDVGRGVDREVLQPIKEVVQDVTEPITKPLVEGVKAAGEVVEDIGEPIIDAAEAVGDVVGDVDVGGVDVGGVSLPSTEGGTKPFMPTYRTPGIIREYTPDVAQIGEYERELDDIAAYLASITGSGMAGGGAVRSSYGNLDELLRIVGGR